MEDKKAVTGKRKPMLVDVSALERAVSSAMIPASLAFPIFDAAGLHLEESTLSPVYRGGVRSTARTPQQKRVRAKGSNRADHVSGRLR